MLKLAGSVGAAAFLFSAAFAQVPEMHDSSAVGIAAGSMAPDFLLPDQSGVRRALNSLAGPNGLVLVFVRSADW